MGLAPLLVSRTIDAIKQLKDQYQLTVLMAEQNFTQAIRIADRGYVIVHGKIAVDGRSTEELNDNELIKKFYLGLWRLHPSSRKSSREARLCGTFIGRAVPSHRPPEVPARSAARLGAQRSSRSSAPSRTDRSACRRRTRGRDHGLGIHALELATSLLFTPWNCTWTTRNSDHSPPLPNLTSPSTVLKV